MTHKLTIPPKWDRPYIHEHCDAWDISHPRCHWFILYILDDVWWAAKKDCTTTVYSSGTYVQYIFFMYDYCYIVYCLIMRMTQTILCCRCHWIHQHLQLHASQIRQLSLRGQAWKIRECGPLRLKSLRQQLCFRRQYLYMHQRVLITSGWNSSQRENYPMMTTQVKTVKRMNYDEWHNYCY